MTGRLSKYVLIRLAFAILAACLFIPSASAEVFSTVSGRVIDAETGKGVANIHIEARMVSNWDWRRHTIADKDGFYALEKMPQGEYSLSYYNVDDGYIDEFEAKLVTVASGKNIVNLNYTIKTGYSISGSVYDSDGTTPIGSISIVARGFNEQYKKDVSEPVVTDVNGNFLIKGLPYSKTYTISAQIPGFAFLHKTIDPEKDKGQRVVFVLDKSDITGISGVVTRDSIPIINAEILIRDSDVNEIGFNYSDETGRYSIKGVPHGLYTITVFLPAGEGFIKKRNIQIEHGKSIEINFEYNEQ